MHLTLTLDPFVDADFSMRSSWAWTGSLVTYPVGPGDVALPGIGWSRPV